MRRWWNRIAGCVPFADVKKADSEQTPGLSLDGLQATMLEEFRGLRKTLRKQSQAVDALRDRLDAAPEVRRNEQNGEELMRLASAFFHLDHALLDVTACSPRRRQAVALVWLQLEHLLDRNGIRMIREPGAAFDPRLHRVVLTRTPEARDSVVTEMLEPGFIEDGTVRQPARVILGPAREHEQELLEESSVNKTDDEAP